MEMLEDMILLGPRCLFLHREKEVLRTDQQKSRMTFFGIKSNLSLSLLLYELYERVHCIDDFVDYQCFFSWIFFSVEHIQARAVSLLVATAT